MHRRDQAWQAWVIPGVVKQVANNRLKERGGEHHAIVRLFQLRRQIDRQRLRPQSVQRFRISIGKVRKRCGAARGVNRASPEKVFARSLLNGQAGRNRIGRINGVKDKGSYRRWMPRREGHGDCGSVGFAVDIPLRDAQRPTHPIEIFSGHCCPEIIEVDAVARRRIPAGQIHRSTSGDVLFAHVSHRGDVGLEHSGCKLWTQLRLRAAGAALIDQDEIAARRIGMARLIVRVDGQRPSRPSADVDDGVRQ